MTRSGDVVAEIVGEEPASALAAVVAKRADIMELTQMTHDAALTPRHEGGLSHGLRAALACRIARLNEDRPFEAHFVRMMRAAGASAADGQAAATGFAGGEDERLRALLAHVDLVAARPRDATRADIERLRGAGWSEADIVRLSELIAFVSYQVRVAAGLKLLKEAL